MLNHLQILIHPVILLVEGEVQKLEAVGEFGHRVVGDGAAIFEGHFEGHFTKISH